MKNVFLIAFFLLTCPTKTRCQLVAILEGAWYNGASHMSLRWSKLVASTQGILEEEVLIVNGRFKKTDKVQYLM